MELEDDIAAGSVAELAWITGLIRYEENRWVDAETGSSVEEANNADEFSQSTPLSVNFQS